MTILKLKAHTQYKEWTVNTRGSVQRYPWSLKSLITSHIHSWQLLFVCTYVLFISG